MNRSTAEWISTVFKIGTLPLAPGTWCSLGVTLLWLFLFPGHSLLLLPVLTVIVFLAGVYSSQVLVNFTREQDPSRIVIDEWAGQWICFIGIPVDWKYALGGFILFRLFDILKPPPVRQFESMPGGWGIMADDVMAGLLALICLQGYRFFS